MARRTSIRELLSRECDRLIKNKKFNSLRPIECLNCGNKTDFSRKIFELKGFYKKEDDIDPDQKFVRWHMHKKWNLESIFFKIHRNKDFVDTAFCSKCDSNKIMYDLHIDDDMFKEMSKILNVPEDEIRQGLAETMSKLGVDSDRRTGAGL